MTTIGTPGFLKTTTLLGAAPTFYTSQVIDLYLSGAMGGLGGHLLDLWAFADVNGTITMENSIDAVFTNRRIQFTLALVGGTVASIEGRRCIGRFFRVQYENTGAAQATFELHGFIRPG